MGSGYEQMDKEGRPDWKWKIAAIGVAIGDKGYIGIGYNLLELENSLKDFWEYVPE